MADLLMLIYTQLIRINEIILINNFMWSITTSTRNRRHQTSPAVCNPNPTTP